MDRTMVTKLILDASSYQKGVDLAKQATASINKELELWKVRNNAANDSIRTLTQQAKANADTQKILTAQIDLTKQKLQEVTTAQGENSKAAMVLQNKLTDLEIAQAKLNKEIGGGLTPLQNLKNGMIAAGEKLKSIGGQVTSFGKTVTMSLTGPIVAAGAGLLKLASDSAEYADSIGLAAEKTGMSIKSVQEMTYVTNQLDVDFEKVQANMTSFTARLKGMEEGSGDTVKAIKALGIATEDSQGKTRAINDLYMESIEKLAGMTNESDRNITAARLFGKSWAEIAPLLNAGSSEIERLRKQAGDLGIVMSDDGINSAREYGDMIDSLKMQFQAIATQIGVSFMPLIKDTLVPFIQNSVIPAVKSFIEGVKGLIEWFKNLSPETQKTIGIIIALVAALGPVITVIGSITTAIGILMPVMAALTGPVGIVIVAVAALAAGIIYLWNTNEGFRNFIIEAWNKIRDTAITVFNGVKSAVETVVSAITSVINTVGRALEFIGILNKTKIEDKTYTVTEIHKTVNSSATGTGGGMSGGTSKGGGGSSGGGFAEGTNYASPGLHWVGEKGPELLNFKGGESVTPINKVAGNTFNITITGNTIANDMDINNIGDQLVRYLKSKGVSLANAY